MAKTNSALAPIDGFPPALMALDIQEIDPFVDELGKAISETEIANQARWRRLAEQFPGQVPTTPAEFIDFFASEYHWTLEHIAGLDDFQTYAFVEAALQRRKATSRRSGRETAEHQPVNRKKHRGRPADTDPGADKRIYDAWKSGQYKRYADLAQVLKLREKDVARAIDRHRKRLERNSAGVGINRRTNLVKSD